MIKRFLVALMLLQVSAFSFAQEPYPPEYWALRSVISNVQLSPDGSRLALMKIANANAEPIIEVYNTDDLSAKPFRVGGGRMEIQSFGWVSNDVFVMQLRQQVRDDIDGFNEGVFEYKVGVVDVKRETQREFRDLGARVVSLLPQEDDKILIALYPRDNSARGATAGAYRAQSYYKLDLDRFTKQLVLRGNSDVGSIGFTDGGEPWVAASYSSEGVGYFLTLYREDGSWEVAHQQPIQSFDEFSVRGFDAQNPNIWFVVANNGRDKAGLWEYYPAEQRFGELIYARNDVDIRGVGYHSNAYTNPDEVSYVTYSKDTLHRVFMNPNEEQLYAQLEQILAQRGISTGVVSISSRSNTGTSMVVNNRSDRDPGSYYLIHNGRLQEVGQAQPLLETQSLAEVSYIEYEARDGKTIPAYVTTPQGEGPFPLVVMPHGGPFVAELVVFDRWAQMLANNGYMVLQPQYRGSHGHGLEHYQSAFIDGGRGGYEMQNDKDDGALHLIEQGMVDSDRVAMFGWSYGGYAALVAASREEPIYQCVISGAAVADNDMQLNHYVSRLSGAQRIEQESFWRDSFNPVDHVEDMNIPMLLVHGDLDQRVPFEHYEDYKELLEEHNKPVQYLVLEGADHFSNTLTFDHQKALYTRMLEFLANDCGEGGL